MKIAKYMKIYANGLRGVCHQKLMDFAPPHHPLIPENGHLVWDYPLHEISNISAK